MKLHRALTHLAVILAIFAVTGCATFSKMELTGKSESIDVTQKSLVLVTAKLVNDIKPSYQPDAKYMSVETQNAQQKKEIKAFSMDKEGRIPSESGNEFLYRLSVPPGRYILRVITGGAGTFPVSGLFTVPIHTEFYVPQQKIVYIGRIVAVNRTRAESEERAGPIIPLIDQAVTGFSGGTWDVQISDNQDADMEMLLSRFPALKQADVEKQILPAWDRERAKKGWDYH